MSYINYKIFVIILIISSWLFKLSVLNLYPQQIKNYGLPFIKNYSPEDYKASEQNWAIYQDERGIFYFGNTLGILEFDGITWRLIELPNKSYVRSICTDTNGRIFIGGSNEIGYLESDSLGSTRYVSILQLIPKECQSFNDVWDIFNLNGEMIFRTHHYIFILKNNKITVIKAPNDLRSASLVGKKLFITDVKSGILLLENNTLKPILSYESLSYSHPIVLPFNDHELLIATRNTGLFLYDGQKLIPWKTNINDFIIKNILYCAIPIDTNYYALGTWLNGLIIVDKTGKVIQFLSKKEGLLSNSIYNLYIDNQKNLWCALDGGISRIEINSPFTYGTAKIGFETPCYAAILYNNKFYIGGSPYLYYHDWNSYEDPMNRKPFVKIDKTAPQVWQLKEIDGKLYGAHSFDLLRINQNNVETFPVNNKIIWDLKIAEDNPQLMLAGEDDGIYVLKKESNQWKLRNKIEGFSGLARWIVHDKKDNFWFTTYGNRIFKLKINKNYDRVTSLSNYDIKPNYPLAVGNRLTIINEKIIVSGEDGYYLYNEIHDRFEPYKELNNLIVKGEPVNITGYDPKGNIWFTDLESIGEFLKQPNGSYKVNRTPFYKFDLPSESYPVFTINDSNVIIGRSNEFIHYDPTYKKEYKIPFCTLIRKMVLLNHNSLIYNGGELSKSTSQKSNTSKIKIEYQENSIRFEYVATSYENIEKNQFQYKLTGYENNWSNWTTEPKKEYTNLPEGNYTFNVRARNVYHEIGKPANLEFTIQPPWYRSVWAYLMYLFMLAGFVYIIVYLYSHRLKAANTKLEATVQERTTEIISQKELIQLQFEQLKEAHGVKDKFYSIISHDLINAIGNIRSFSELLKMYASGLYDDKLNKYSNGLYTSATSAFELLNNLLNWTRLQTGRIKLNPDNINLIDLVNDTILFYRSIIDKKKLYLLTEYPDELFIYADKNMISTILRNLLSNAVKFTPENGKIFINVNFTEKEYTCDIIDSGVGMNEEELKSLFRKDVIFQRQGTNFESGTGFGLLLIKDFIELHKGKISVESEPNKGSKFSIKSPINCNGL